MIAAIAAAATIVAAALVWRFVLRPHAPSQGWYFGPILQGRNYTLGMSERPETVGAGWRFSLAPGQEVDGVLQGAARLAGTIHLRYRFAGAVYPSEYPDHEPLLALFFQRRGDDWSAQGAFAFYRWYHILGPLAPGEYETTVPLTAEAWSSVNGKSGADAAVEFAEALSACACVGVGFGHNMGLMHGVCTAATATFEMLAFEVVP